MSLGNIGNKTPDPINTEDIHFSDDGSTDSELTSPSSSISQGESKEAGASPKSALENSLLSNIGTFKAKFANKQKVTPSDIPVASTQKKTAGLFSKIGRTNSTYSPDEPASLKMRVKGGHIRRSETIGKMATKAMNWLTGKDKTRVSPEIKNSNKEKTK